MRVHEANRGREGAVDPRTTTSRSPRNAGQTRLSAGRARSGDVVATQLAWCGRWIDLTPRAARAPQPIHRERM
jgi:hypothetical protein